MEEAPLSTPVAAALGPQEELEQLWRTARAQAARFAGQEADDVAQEAMIRFLRLRATVERARPWLRVVVRRMAVKAASSRWEEAHLTRDQPAAPERVAGPGVNADLRLDIGRAMAHLRAQERWLLQSSAMGYSMRELADLAGVTTAAIKVRLFRARAKLRVLLES